MAALMIGRLSPNRDREEVCAACLLHPSAFVIHILYCQV